jgi:hypothetical protein
MAKAESGRTAINAENAECKNAEGRTSQRAGALVLVHWCIFALVHFCICCIGA